MILFHLQHDEVNSTPYGSYDVQFNPKIDFPNCETLKFSGKFISHILMSLTSTVGIVTSLIQMYMTSTLVENVWSVNVLVDISIGVFCLQYEIFSMQVSAT